MAEAVEGFGLTCGFIDSRNMRALELEGDPRTPRLVVDGLVVDARSTVWLRRPWRRAVPLDVVDDRLRRFAEGEWRHALLGGIAATGCRVVNDPASELKAQYKPWQLAVATRVGLPTPTTCVTNRPATAERFREQMAGSGHRTVYKPLTPLEYHVGETREFLGLTDESRASFEVAPVVLQQCIEKGIDTRVFIAGASMTGAKVLSRHGELIDWRMDPAVSYEPWDVPVALESRLRSLMEALNLQTGSCDFRLDPGGSPYFLEVNPGGQFLFLEDALGAPLSVDLARLLSRRA
ncbi:hypothetical protein [Kineococcus sp. SYSU DK001]|uniref:hypothetical protein n=1 Tax=Kineococcus sp. SYSU DK001 TaxID=3383122 RepID=UPI003D7D9818